VARHVYRKSTEELIEKYANFLELDIINNLNILKEIIVKIEQKHITNDTLERKEIEKFIEQLEVLNRLFIYYVE